jgi:hypothetical protein
MDSTTTFGGNRMIDIPAAAMLSVSTALITGGVAYGSVKQALNGTRERVKKIEENQRNHEVQDEERFRDAADRLARIETKIDILLEKR